MTDAPTPPPGDRRPLLSAMADDYAAYALSQRRSFEHTFPVVVEIAREHAAEPVLRVMDQGAADGVNSHALIRALAAERDGRPLVYGLVDMPTNNWAVAAEHITSGRAGLGEDVVVLPAPGDPRAADRGTGPHFATAADADAAVAEALAGTPAPRVVIVMAGIPLHAAPCTGAGGAHLAVTGTAMHWVEAPPSLGSTGSVFPGYADHRDEAERAQWRDAAAAQWRRLLENRAVELAPGGALVGAVPASADGDPARRGPYAEMVAVMNRVLAEWVADGRIREATADAVVTPVWMRTAEEIRAPFARGRHAGLALERSDVYRVDNPYMDADAVVFAERYVRSCLAWGRPLFVSAFAREDPDGAGELLGAFTSELERRAAGEPERFRWDYTQALVVCRQPR